MQNYWAWHPQEYWYPPPQNNFPGYPNLQNDFRGSGGPQRNYGGNNYGGNNFHGNGNKYVNAQDYSTNIGPGTGGRFTNIGPCAGASNYGPGAGGINYNNGPGAGAHNSGPRSGHINTGPV
ncbi:hypothetical protein SLE2022_154110 [Rubroshorea leprosula]